MGTVHTRHFGSMYLAKELVGNKFIVLRPTEIAKLNPCHIPTNRRQKDITHLSSQVSKTERVCENCACHPTERQR